MDDNILVNNIMKAYLAQIDSSLKISDIICQHSNREELTGDDIICGLIYRLMTPMSNDELQLSLNNASSILNDELEDDELEDDELEDDELEDDENNINYEIPKISRKIKSNHCNCEICMNVRVCLLNYKNYECNDELSQKFKNSIDETCGKFKIYI